ncbi:ABC transporter ATP-binding protein [Ferrovibrio sp.]|uniref:ABC transporter ATP-binding protein n=1 Tax=Ferrovibrio sp. TaxID=1917215 RepID=UPI001B79CEC4|nr:ABC transporter ATP-binding protein [Ferrovibrio sp.]MBP7065554.1 ABC transporter ATP-binding protein [Ferrovibrio sp.]
MLAHQDSAEAQAVPDMSALIDLQRVTKQYRIYNRPVERLRDILFPGSPRYGHTVTALSDVSLAVHPGECLGLIGANGSGKSSLLKLIVGTSRPTQGKVAVRGNVLAMLELGSGLNPDLTGRANIHAMATMLGFPPGYSASREADIVGFSGLNDFIDMPVRKYSSGMVLRLGFSLYSFLEPKVLIIDEALAVGDADFQLKCFRRIEELTNHQERAAILVSHDMNAINRFCDRVIWLEKGRVMASGEPEEVTRQYIMSSTRSAAVVEAPKKTAVSQFLPLSPAAIIYESPICAISEVRIEDGDGNPLPTLQQGQRFCIAYSVDFGQDMAAPVFGIRVVNKRGDVVISTNSLLERLPVGSQSAGSRAELSWPIRAGLLPGDYFISCGVSRADALHDFAARYIDAFPFHIHGDAATAGYFLLDGPPGFRVRE